MLLCQIELVGEQNHGKDELYLRAKHTMTNWIIQLSQLLLALQLQLYSQTLIPSVDKVFMKLMFTKVLIYVQCSAIISTS